jgi:hypothetical protein
MHYQLNTSKNRALAGGWSADVHARGCGWLGALSRADFDRAV